MPITADLSARILAHYYQQFIHPSPQKHVSQMSQMSQTRSILKMKIALLLLQLREIVICFSTVEAPYVKG